MRTLVIVGVSPDGGRLLLATTPGGKAAYAVANDERLQRAQRGQSLDAADATRSSLSPREIQARLRAGATVGEVAKEAGVPVARVERYAGPVISEREKVLDEVRAARISRPRIGASVAPLGEAVAANLAATAFAHPETAEWTAYRREDGRWVGRFEVVVRGRRKRAEWVLDGTDHAATPLDGYAAVLGHTSGSRSDPTSVSKSSVSPSSGAKSRAAKKSAKRSATKLPATKLPATKLPATKPARATKSPARPGRARPDLNP